MDEWGGIGTAMLSAGDDFPSLPLEERLKVKSCPDFGKVMGEALGIKIEKDILEVLS